MAKKRVCLTLLPLCQEDVGNIRQCSKIGPGLPTPLASIFQFSEVLTRHQISVLYVVSLIPSVSNISYPAFSTRCLIFYFHLEKEKERRKKEGKEEARERKERAGSRGRPREEKKRGRETERHRCKETEREKDGWLPELSCRLERVGISCCSQD